MSTLTYLELAQDEAERLSEKLEAAKTLLREASCICSYGVHRCAWCLQRDRFVAGLAK